MLRRRYPRMLMPAPSRGRLTIQSGKKNMKIKDSVVLVTGANRGLGKAFVQQLLLHGASKVYAAARDPSTVTEPGAIPIKLDVTSFQDIEEAARRCSDVTILINNAGISRGSGLLGEGSEDAARAEMETNVFGPLALSRAFAPILRQSGGGAIVNVLSVLSWFSLPGGATYCMSKAAAWSMTNGLRNELATQGTQVVGVHVGFMDTDMTRRIDQPKADPKDVVKQVLQALEADRSEVLADLLSREVKSGLSADPAIYLQVSAS